MIPQEMQSPKTVTWQKKLLPLMIGILVALTLFFFIASLTQLYYLHQRIENCPQLELNQLIGMMEQGVTSKGQINSLEDKKWRGSVLLEGYSIQRRYHQANVLLMSRVWTKYLGFITGMILALVGATFILGKLREPETKLSGEGAWKFSIITASPGLILTLVGTILMLTVIVTHFEITVEDIPLYTKSVGEVTLVKPSGGGAEGLPSPEGVFLRENPP